MDNLLWFEAVADHAFKARYTLDSKAKSGNPTCWQRSESVRHLTQRSPTPRSGANETEPQRSGAMTTEFLAA